MHRLKIVILTIKDIISDMFTDEETFKFVCEGCFGCAILIIGALLWIFFTLFLASVIITMWQHLMELL